MRVQVFSHFMDDALAYDGYIFDTGDTEAALEEVFRFLNQDDRPNGGFMPSLSVGDSITLIGGPRCMRNTWTVRGTGFERTTFHQASVYEVLDYSRKQRASGRPTVTQIPTSRTTS